MSGHRVLFVTPWYPTPERPSLGVFVREHARSAAISNDVAVVHLAGPGSRYIEEIQDERLRAGIPAWRVYQRYISIARTESLSQTFALERALRWLRRERDFAPELIHAHVFLAGFPSILVGRFRSVPVVVSEHYSVFPMGSLAPHDLLKARVTFRLADRVLPVSNFLKVAIEASGLRGRYEIVPNAIDTSIFFPGDGSDAPPPTTLLFVGQLDEDKGIEDLLLALADPALRSRQWQLVVIGGGAQDRYRTAAAESGIASKISFLGSIPKAEVASWMRKSDALVVPSWYETQSVVTLEAMASGLPVLASDVGELGSMLADGRGALFKARDTPSQVLQLSRFLDGQLELGGARRAKEVADRYSLERVGSQLTAIYDTVLSERS